jgi:transformation/transcription domain-associated protein
MMFGLLEPITAKESSSGIERLLGIMVESCLERLEALALMYEGVSANMALLKDNTSTAVGPALIEKARPVGGAFYAIEKPEEVIHGQFDFPFAPVPTHYDFRVT